MATTPEPELDLNLYWTAHTDRGKVRANNEDSFLALQFDAHEVRYLGKIGEASTRRNDFIFAVSDGMGGALAGEFASRIAVEKITKMLPKAFGQAATGIGPGHSDVLAELFQEIHKALNYLGLCYEECQGMGATLSLCWFTPGWMYFGHIGDSRIYFLPKTPVGSEAEIKQVTHDDTHVGWLFRNGQINEREARNHPRKNALSKALGADHQFVDPQVGAVGYGPGDRFFLCTDGVVDGLYNRQILRLLESPEPPEALRLPAERIVAAAVEQSGKDNATGMLIEVA